LKGTTGIYFLDFFGFVPAGWWQRADSDDDFVIFQNSDDDFVIFQNSQKYFLY